MDISSQQREERKKLEALIDEAACLLGHGSVAEMDRLYAELGMQPTSNAARLAAEAAVAVLLAHELGQRTGAEMERLNSASAEAV